MVHHDCLSVSSNSNGSVTDFLSLASFNYQFACVNSTICRTFVVDKNNIITMTGKTFLLDSVRFSSVIFLTSVLANDSFHQNCTKNDHMHGRHSMKLATRVTEKYSMSFL